MQRRDQADGRVFRFHCSSWKNITGILFGQQAAHTPVSLFPASGKDGWGKNAARDGSLVVDDQCNPFSQYSFLTR